MKRILEIFLGHCLAALLVSCSQGSSQFAQTDRSTETVVEQDQRVTPSTGQASSGDGVTAPLEADPSSDPQPVAEEDTTIDDPAMVAGSYMLCGTIEAPQPEEENGQAHRVGCSISDSDGRIPVNNGLEYTFVGEDVQGMVVPVALQRILTNDPLFQAWDWALQSPSKDWELARVMVTIKQGERQVSRIADVLPASNPPPPPPSLEGPVSLSVVGLYAGDGRSGALGNCANIEENTFIWEPERRIWNRRLLVSIELPPEATTTNLEIRANMCDVQSKGFFEGRMTERPVFGLYRIEGDGALTAITATPVNNEQGEPTPIGFNLDTPNLPAGDYAIDLTMDNGNGRVNLDTIIIQELAINTTAGILKVRHQEAQGLVAGEETNRPHYTAVQADGSTLGPITIDDATSRNLGGVTP